MTENHPLAVPCSAPRARRGDVIDRVREYFVQHPTRQVTTADLSRHVNARVDSLRTTMRNLSDSGFLRRVGCGRYVLTPPSPEQPDEPEFVQEPEQLRLEILHVLLRDGGALTFRELIDALGLAPWIGVKVRRTKVHPIDKVAREVLALRERGLIIGEHEGDGPARIRRRPSRRRLGEGVRAVGVSTDVLALGKVKHAECDGDGCSSCRYTGYV